MKTVTRTPAPFVIAPATASGPARRSAPTSPATPPPSSSPRPGATSANRCADRDRRDVVARAHRGLDGGVGVAAAAPAVPERIDRDHGGGDDGDLGLRAVAGVAERD